MKKLLSSGVSNAKTKKNQRPTKILYLHPSKIEGKDMCPFASKGCRMSCLNTAGRGAMNSVQLARILRTEKYVLQRDDFLRQLHKEIQSFSRYYVRKGQEVAVRLNGTSDQPLLEAMQRKDLRFNYNIVFYDYTKNHKKAGTRYGIDGNRYVVTFSYSEKEGSETQALEVLSNGGHVAIVFDELPKTWNGYPVVNGDERDDLMVDLKQPSVIGLLAKGKAKQDTTGFVVKKTSEHMWTPEDEYEYKYEYDDEPKHWERMSAHLERYAY